jgi:hypothetical protein
MRSRAIVPLALLLVAGALSCRPDPSGPRGVAERFLDAYYVRIDLPAVHAMVAGVAKQKIEKEMKLVEGQVIDESTRKPTVRYHLLEEHPDGEDAVNFIYRGRITVEDADSFERRWLVTVRRRDGDWRVTNFQELPG